MLILKNLSAKIAKLKSVVDVQTFTENYYCFVFVSLCIACHETLQTSFYIFRRLSFLD